MSNTLSGMTALVTGAAQGIGAGIAERFAAEGASVAILDVDAVAGRRIESRLSASGRNVRFYECDLRQTDAVSATVERAWVANGRIDVLVNNAAAHGPRRPMLEYSVDDWRDVVATNLTGTFWLTREVVRRMVAAAVRGSIVNILAIQTQVPLATYSAYVATKGALEALTRAMAVEFAEHGIRVNGVMLGAVYSGSTRGAAGHEDGEVDYEKVPKEMDAKSPTLVRRMGRPSDVANAVMMLASPASGYITGAVLPVDGGRLLNRGSDIFSDAAARKRERMR